MIFIIQSRSKIHVVNRPVLLDGSGKIRMQIHLVGSHLKNWSFAPKLFPPTNTYPTRCKTKRHRRDPRESQERICRIIHLHRLQTEQKMATWEFKSMHISTTQMHLMFTHIDARPPLLCCKPTFQREQRDYFLQNCTIWKVNYLTFIFLFLFFMHSQLMLMLSKRNINIRNWRFTFSRVFSRRLCNKGLAEALTEPSPGVKTSALKILCLFVSTSAA